MDFQDRLGDPAKLNLGDMVTIETTGRVTIENPRKGTLSFRCRCNLDDADESTLLIHSPGRPSGSLDPEAVIQLICCAAGLDYRRHEKTDDKSVYEIVPR